MVFPKVLFPFNETINDKLEAIYQYHLKQAQQQNCDDYLFTNSLRMQIRKKACGLAGFDSTTWDIELSQIKSIAQLAQQDDKNFSRLTVGQCGLITQATSGDPIYSVMALHASLQYENRDCRHTQIQLNKAYP